MIGAEERLTTRRGRRLFCYHVSSRTDVNLREGRARERERERGRDGAERRGLKGEERGRSVRASAAPSLLSLALAASLFLSPPHRPPQVRFTWATSRDKSYRGLMDLCLIRVKKKKKYWFLRASSTCWRCGLLHGLSWAINLCMHVLKMSN